MLPVGSHVKFVRTTGVASPRMRSYVGEIGKVTKVWQRAGKVVVEVEFNRSFEDPALSETFVLNEGEWEESAPPTPPPLVLVPQMPRERVMRLSWAEFHNKELRYRRYGDVR